VFDPGLGAIPKRDVSGPAFSSVVMGSIFARQGRILYDKEVSLKKPRKNKQREKTRAGLGGLIACGSAKSRQSSSKSG
jgi:hypothetical protein